MTDSAVKFASYVPCQIVCVERFSRKRKLKHMMRVSCRHGCFVVVWGYGNRMVESMCRTQRALALLDDYGAGRVSVTDGDRVFLRAQRLIP